MKVCTRCKATKPIDDFYRKKASSDGRHAACKACEKEAERPYRLAYRQREAEQERLREREAAPERADYHKRKHLGNRARYRDWLAGMKEGQSCVECGESTPVCLDFHHRKPEEKAFLLSRAYRHGGGLATMKAEAAKCVLLCANCHRKVHAGLLELSGET